MAVMTPLQKASEIKGQEIMTKKHAKYYHKTRPITATLDHPLILDIKLLKKLDMTTFTKKGLIALSRFCGISLINKTDTKKKLNKCVKTLQYTSKHVEKERKELNTINESSKNSRNKRKITKQNIKGKSRIRFKMPKEDTSPDEDSLDVICGNHKKVSKTSNHRPGTSDKASDRKSTVNNVLNNKIESIIPEPCKTCSRSDHPERFHSHPTMFMRLASQEKRNEENLEEKFRNAVTTKDADYTDKDTDRKTTKNERDETKKTSCAKENEAQSLQKSAEEKFEKTSSGKILSLKHNSKSLGKSSSSTGLSSPETGGTNKSRNSLKTLTPLSSGVKTKPEISQKTSPKVEFDQNEGNKINSGKENLRFLTGCYICGKQVSPKLRIKHEKICISEWRSQNSSIPPDKRKPEPKRPDYRFTASGDLDFKGTFDSIWANHMDSLVPCKKCGRKFFPDRIERHENCCNNAPISFKYKH